MSLRFRRSIQIVPGLKLNISRGGLSISAGIRGIGITAGPRGVFGHVGLPGTGLSCQEKLSGAGSNRAFYRAQRKRAEEEAEKARTEETADAAKQQDEAERRIAQLRTIIAARSKMAFDWSVLVPPVSEFVPQPYAAIESVDTPPANKQLTRRARLVLGTALSMCSIYSVPLSWRFMISSGTDGQASNWVGPALLLLLAGVGGSLYGLVLIFGDPQQSFLGDSAETIAARRKEQAAALQATRALDEEARSRRWEESEAERRTRWDDEVRERQQFRAAVESRDPDILSEVLHAELASQEWPVPLAFDLGLSEGAATAEVNLTLPDNAVVPSDRTYLTKTGKLSSSPMPWKDWVATYTDLCCGLALRMVHELFRVLPMTNHVHLVGTFADRDPATGHELETVALDLAVDRVAFLSLDLDYVQPLPALEGLSGRFGCDKKGNLTGLTDVMLASGPGETRDEAPPSADKHVEAGLASSPASSSTSTFVAQLVSAQVPGREPPPEQDSTTSAAPVPLEPQTSSAIVDVLAYQPTTRSVEKVAALAFIGIALALALLPADLVGSHGFLSLLLAWLGLALGIPPGSFVVRWLGSLILALGGVALFATLSENNHSAVVTERRDAPVDSSRREQEGRDIATDLLRRELDAQQRGDGCPDCWVAGPEGEHAVFKNLLGYESITASSCMVTVGGPVAGPPIDGLVRLTVRVRVQNGFGGVSWKNYEAGAVRGPAGWKLVHFGPGERPVDFCMFATNSPGFLNRFNLAVPPAVPTPKSERPLVRVQPGSSLPRPKHSHPAPAR